MHLDRAALSEFAREADHCGAVISEVLVLVVNHERADRHGLEPVRADLVLDELLTQQLRQPVSIVRPWMRLALVHYIEAGPIDLRGRKKHDSCVDSLRELQHVVDPAEVGRNREAARPFARDAAHHRREQKHHVRIPVERRQQVDRMVDVRHDVPVAPAWADVGLQHVVAGRLQMLDERRADVSLRTDDKGLVHDRSCGTRPIGVAGTPPTMENGSTLDVTTAPAPIIDPRPRTTPGSTIAPAPIHTSSSIAIGASSVTPNRGRRVGC